MPTYSTFFLTLTSISAVLLSICVSLRNASFSPIVSGDAQGVQLGDHNYETILKKTGQRVQYAGFAFLISVGLALAGTLQIGIPPSSPTGITVRLYQGVIITFASGILLLAWALTTSFVQLPAPTSNREETEPQNGDGDE
jgi:hypothetical protein